MTSHARCRHFGWSLAMVSLCVAAAPEGAFAHSRAPATNGVQRSGTGDGLLVTTTFGLLTSQPDGGFAWMCEEAVGYGDAFDPWVAPAKQGGWVVASGRGVFHSADGCHWAPRGTPALQSLTDFVELPGGDLLAVTANAPSSVYRSNDSAETWTLVYSRADLQLLSLRVAPSRPQRWYLTAQVRATSQALLLVSDDAGASFIEHAGGGAEQVLNVLDVSPVDPDTAALARAEAVRHAVVWSADAGAQLDEVAENPYGWRSAAFSADGRSLWAATAAGTPSLHRLSATGAAGEQGVETLSAPAGNACLSRVDQALYACGSQGSDGWVLAKLVEAATPPSTLQPVLRWEDITGPLECPPGSATHDVCGPLWPGVRVNLGLTMPVPDAGTIPPSPSNAEGPPPGEEGCGCASGGGPLLLACVWMAVRRSRRARSKA